MDINYPGAPWRCRPALALLLLIWQEHRIWSLNFSMVELPALLEAVRDFYQGLHRAMDVLMKSSGASFARTKLLLFIQRSGPVRSADIADAFGHAPRTITEAIDGLERAGLVRRDPDPQDRRAKRISVTSAGIAAVQASEPVREQFMQDVFMALSSEERETMAILFAKLNERLTSIDRSQVSRG